MANELAALIGEDVNGFRLGSLVSYSSAGAVLQTEFGPDARPAIIRICEGRPEQLDALTSNWRELLELQHPNLLRIFACGTSAINEVPIAYVVTERAEESLENVLSERALSAEETREMLVPAVAALRFLHQGGYQHGQLDSSQLLAVGDQLKLSADMAVPLRDGETAAEDMRALGVLIVQALTRRSPDGHGTEELPEPFAEIVQHCLDADPSTRWTAEDVEAHLREPETAAVVVPSTEAEPAPWHAAAATEIDQASAPVAEAPVFVEAPLFVDYDPDEFAEEAHVVEDEPGPSPEPVAYPQAVPRRVYMDEEHRDEASRPKWVYALVTGLVLVAVVLGFTWKKDAVVTPATSTVVEQKTVQQGADAAPVVPEAAPPRAAAVPDVPPAAAAFVPDARVPEAAAPVRGKTGGWWVIVAAYNSREAADRRVRALKKAWPRYDVSVAEPQSEKSRYVITIGQGLSQKEADALRKRAVSSGMPRDAYIKRVL
jgi:hypothetical protein